jgi:hypothetical protein
MPKDEVELRLSDAFGDSNVASEFEWTATVKNINLGRNGKLMEKCCVLEEYSILFSQGIPKGENKLARLIKKLKADNRQDELDKVLDDEAARKAMYKEYGITD